MRRLAPDSVMRNDDVEGLALRTTAAGTCLFLESKGCRVHAIHGPEAKPSGCRRFPFGLVATPQGGRVTTEHRCPCRTLGERPAIDMAEAEMSLKDETGRLRADERVPHRVRLSAKRSTTFQRYAEIESRLLKRLAAGADPLRVLRARPLPALRQGSWPAIAAEFLDMNDGSAGGEALAWYADALLRLSAGHRPPRRRRPWAPAFERARARSPAPQSPRQVFNDWVADQLWMLRGLAWGPFDVARAELATRVTLARAVQKRIAALGIRADQAAAEAVMVVEIATESSEWPEAVQAIAREPSALAGKF